jgi:hypothetical protein
LPLRSEIRRSKAVRQQHGQDRVEVRVFAKPKGAAA